MPSQEAVNPRQIKPESCREPETSSPFQQRNVNLQPPRKSVEGYTNGFTDDITSFAKYQRGFKLKEATRVVRLGLKSRKGME